jgi:hypothetical protein
MAAALTSALAIGTTSSSALADSYVTCTPNKVVFEPLDGDRVNIGCTNNNFYTGSRSAACANVDSDMLKGWLSLAQAALLSGKSLYIHYTSCGGNPRQVTAVELWK